MDNLACRNTQYQRIVRSVHPYRSLIQYKVDVLLIRGVAITRVSQFVAGVLKYGNGTYSLLGSILCQLVNGYRRFE